MSAVADTVVAGPALLQRRAVSMRFAGVTALDAVDFSVHTGEVHAQMGGNGAGKSTLMSILNRVYRQDEGEVVLAGVPAQLSGPRSTQALGLAIIHQKLNQVAELSFCENFFLGRELRGPAALAGRTHTGLAAPLSPNTHPLRAPCRYPPGISLACLHTHLLEIHSAVLLGVLSRRISSDWASWALHSTSGTPYRFVHA